MRCSVAELRAKEVINMETGCRIGNVVDVEIDTKTGCLLNIIVFCGKGLCGFFGRGEEITVCWHDIVVIGDDTIIVRKGGVKNTLK